jgi:hypothetical protein
MNQLKETPKPSRSILIKIAVTVLGIIAGYAYYYFVGCRTGSCPLRANPYYNMLLGGLLGYIIADWIISASRKRRSKRESEQNEESK